MRLTNQDIADQLLREDRARRQALERGDNRSVQKHDAEITRLGGLLK